MNWISWCIFPPLVYCAVLQNQNLAHAFDTNQIFALAALQTASVLHLDSAYKKEIMAVINFS